MRVISIVVNIVDAIMGVGKTTSAINYINKSNPDVKFLYITPYLTEIERIIKNCPLKNFKEPKSYGTKLNGIKLLFKKGENIVSTHSLFSLFDEEIIDLATEIDLWNIDLPPISKSKGSKEDISPFAIEGVLRDFVEVNEEVEKIEMKFYKFRRNE